MYRNIWAIVASLGLFTLSGCAMCESCFDYTYPASGGCCDWQVNDCCRAGSVFCHGDSLSELGSPHISDGEMPPDPVPNASEAPYIEPRITEPTPAETIPKLPPSSEVPKPETDLSVPAQNTEPPDSGILEIPGAGTSNTSNSGETPGQGLDLPPLEDLDLPPLNDNGSISDPFNDRDAQP